MRRRFPHAGSGSPTHLICVDDFLTQEAVLPRAGVQQPPVHLEVPGERVARAEHGGHDPQVEEGVVLSVLLTVQLWRNGGNEDRHKTTRAGRNQTALEKWRK